MTTEIFTIGHSTHPIERFLELVTAHGVTAIADVRSTPYSRRHPQFNREHLRDALKGLGIEYVFLGAELGARSEDDACYRDGKVRYERLAQTPAFASGIERVMTGARNYRIALLCAEHEPLECHRTILVARHLVEGGARIAHILRDGSLEPHDVTVGRLISKLPTRSRRAASPDRAASGSDLFISPPHAEAPPGSSDTAALKLGGGPRALIDEAYARQSERIAYRRPARA